MFFYSLLYLAVNCSILFVPEEYLVGFFLGDLFRNSFRMLHSLARQWIHVLRQLMRPFGKNFSLFVLVFGR